MHRAAIGFADHTGWAIAVIVVADGPAFDVLHRERLQLVDPSLPAQAYHAVTERGMPPEVITAVEESALTCARREVARVRDLVTRAGFELADAAVPIGTATVPTSLAAILKRHAMWHAAEGDLYREALAEAAAVLGLRVLRLPRKEIGSFTSTAVGWDETWLANAGKRLGPPWQADHKFAATAAWCALNRADADDLSGKIGL